MTTAVAERPLVSKYLASVREDSGGEDAQALAYQVGAPFEVASFRLTSSLNALAGPAVALPPLDLGADDTPVVTAYAGLRCACSGCFKFVSSASSAGPAAGAVGPQEGPVMEGDARIGVTEIQVGTDFSVFNGGGNGVTGSRQAFTFYDPLVEGLGGQSSLNLQSGYKWGSNIGSPLTVTYSLSTSASAYGYSDPATAGEYPLVPAQVTAAISSLGWFSAFSGLTFSALTDSATQAGDIRFANSSGNVPTAYAYYPFNNASAGDIWFGSVYPDYQAPTVGGYGYYTFIHELGHAVGLRHPHEPGASGGQPTLSAVAGEDQIKYSIMSYRSYANAPLTGLSGNYFPTTPMINDILALQSLYGVNTTYRTGNDTYSWSASSSIFETLWDAGGIDTISAATQTQSSKIYLTPGKWSEMGVAFFNGQSMVRDTLTIAYGAVIENATGSAFADTLEGNGAGNLLNGALGNDSLIGLGGNDTLDGAGGNDSMLGGDGDDSFIPGTGVDLAIGGTGTDTLTLTGTYASYTITKPNATDVLLVNAAASQNVTIREVEFIAFSDGTRPVGALGSNPTTGNDTLVGDSGDNLIDALAGNDSVSGQGGNDTLIGGPGVDTLAGGKGDDVFNIDVYGDLVQENSGQGVDTVQAAFLTAGTYTLPADVENAVITSATAGINLVGNTLDNRLTGNGTANSLTGGDGNDTLDGGAGIDTMAGGLGDDQFIVNVAGDVVNESAAAGYDQVVVAFTAAGTYILPANVETAVVQAPAGLAISVTGNADSNNLTGHDGANTLDGGAGTDFIVGGLGNDVLIGGNDYDYADYFSASGPVNVNLGTGRATGAAGNDTLSGFEAIYGSAFADELRGDANANFIWGGAGNDTMFGDGGADQFSPSDGDDRVEGGDGFDWVYFGTGQPVQVDLDTGIATGEGTDTLIGIEGVQGSSFNDTLRGNAESNDFYPLGGSDFIDGRGGWDRVFLYGVQLPMAINLATGIVSDAEGSDTLVGIEQVWASAFDDTITGSSQDDYVDAFNGNDSVQGFAGADNLAGGAGNDTLRGGDDNDTLRDSQGSNLLDGGAGIDRVEFNTGSSTGVNVNLLSGTAQIGSDVSTLISIEQVVGTSLNDTLVGDNGNNTLDGAAGSDSLVGGGGIDTADYSRGTGVSASLATGIATSGTDTDTLQGIENLLGSGSNDTLTGDGGPNVLSGGKGNDSISGGAGLDTLNGGKGTDTVDGGADSDTLKLDGNRSVFTISRPNGTDTAFAGPDGTVTARNIELVQFNDGTFTLAQLLSSVATPNNDTLEGDAGDNLIDGLGGNDSISGLGGNDTLIGGIGIDTLVGGPGNDVFGVDVASDVVVENPGEGTDLVNVGGTVAFSYTLPAQVENATVTSTAAVGLVGNTLDNLLTGNAAGNLLVGGDGADTLNGAGGTDTLQGGAGDDSYVVDTATDVVNETAPGSNGYDQVTVAFTAAGTYTLPTDVEAATATNGVLAINLTGNALDNNLQGNDGNNSLNGLAGHDVIFGGAGNDTLVGDSGDDYMQGGPGNDQIIGGTGFNSVEYFDATGPITANLVTGIVTGGAGTDTLSGIWRVWASEFGDTLLGSTAADEFYGRGGNDVVDAGGGNDVVGGGEGNDTLQGGAGFDSLRFWSATGPVNVNLATGQSTGEGTDSISGFEAVLGSSYNDTLIGSGADENFEGGAGNDSIVGGLGIDRIEFWQSSGVAVNVNLLTGSVIGAGLGVGVDTISGIENVTGSAANDTITGDANANALDGWLGDNLIDGGAGNDFLSAGKGSDTLRGGNDNDTIDGGDGNDSLDGGAGSDTLQFQNVTSAVTASLATNTASSAGGAVDSIAGFENLSGSAYNDTLTGSSIANQIFGNDGNDSLVGGDGNDSLFGGKGNDVLDGGLANDQLRADAGNDTVLGGDGNDYITGGPGNDSLVGGAGFDTADYFFDDQVGAINASLATGVVTGGAGSDTLVGIENLNGSSFNDTLTGDVNGNTLEGRDGNDSILGGGGGDALIGGNGNDTLRGEAGNDFFRGGAGNDLIDGGAVLDRINYNDGNSVSYSDSTGAVNVNLSGITGDGSVGSGTAADGLGGTDTLVNVPFFTLSPLGDVFVGSQARIFEQVEGGAGDDTLDGGVILDTLNATDSNRVNYTNAPGPVTVDLAAGTATGAAGNDQLSNFIQARGSVHNDTLLGSNTTTFTEVFQGAGGNDRIDGRGGNDIVRYDTATSSVTVNLAAGTASDGLGGTDTLIGIEGVQSGSFDDLLLGGNPANGTNRSDPALFEFFRGGAGNDTIDGGQGWDRVDYNSSTAGVNVKLNDTLDGTASDGLGGTDLLRNIEAVRGSDFNDTLVGSDTAPLESFGGLKGNDILDGRGGIDRADYQNSPAGVNVNLALGTASDGWGGTDTLLSIENVRGSRDTGDTLVGNAVANRLEGLGGNDNLQGAAGDDTLLGGTGVDTLDGGADTDTVVVLGPLSSYALSRPTATDLLLTNAATGENLTLRNVEYVEFTDQTRTVVDLLSNAASAFNDTLIGTAGPDFFDGLAGNDSITGLGGDDTLIGGPGIDTLVGGPGNDVLGVDTATDLVVEQPGEGVDLVQVAFTLAGTYALPQNVENATVTAGPAVAANVVGNALDNVITGNAAANALTGDAGNDTLDGGAGNDTLTGGDGDDVYVVNVAGDVINETAVGSSGTDLVRVDFSAAGVYVLPSGVENAQVVGSAPLQVGVTGNALDNVLTGGVGNNSLSGLLGNDGLSGGDGNDTLDGGDGNDLLEGGAGNDLLVGGSGIDGADYRQAPTAINVNLSSGLATGAGNDTLAGIEDVFGSPNADTMVGNTGVNNLLGGDGNDQIDGGDGDDFLFGEAGNDVLIGGAGSDYIDAGDGSNTLDGGDGDDFLFTGPAGNDLVLGGAGYNRVYYASATTPVLVNLATGTATGAGTDTLVGIEGVRGGTANDTLLGSAGDNDMEGNLGADSLVGGLGTDLVRFTTETTGIDVNLQTGRAITPSGTDTLSGFENVRGSFQGDTIVGDSGGNVLDGHAGNDAIDGGDGNDTLIGGQGNDTLTGGNGTDTVSYESAGGGVSVTKPQSSSLVTVGTGLDGMGGTDRIEHGTADVLIGSAFNDTLTGSPIYTAPWGEVFGNDVIRGGAGNDTIDGLAGNDDLHGENGNDSLSGGDGDDTLAGGAGNDTLSGGAQTDFDFADYRSAAGPVVINLASGTATGDGSDQLIGIEGVFGSSFNDSFTGSNVPQAFFRPGPGNDTITGNGGFDIVDYGDASSPITLLMSGIGSGTATGHGTDVFTGIEAMFGSNQADSITGSAGAETLRGQRGNDTLDGGGGIDRADYRNASGPVTVNLATNSSSGADGNDVLLNFENVRGSLTHDDTLIGNAGNNLLDGMGGNDSLVGGDGNDTLRGAGGNDTLDGGGQLTNDFADYRQSVGGVTVNLATGVATGDGTDTLISIEGVLASVQADSLIGSSGNNYFWPNLGDDTIDGGSGGDDAIGYDGLTLPIVVNFTGPGTGTATGAGTDVFSNIDAVIGGQGNDLITMSSADELVIGNGGNDTLHGGGGIDRVDYRFAPAAVTVNLATGTASGGDGSDVFTGFENARGSTSFGDTLIGDAGPNNLDGMGGNDSLSGGAGDDTLLGGTGVDTLDGGADIDTVVLLGAYASYGVTRPNATDVVLVNAATGENLTLRNVDVLQFTDGAKSIVEVLGNAASAFNDTLVGDAGANLIDGLAGNDSISGLDGPDTLIGGAGIDTLVGGPGDDLFSVDVPTDVIVEAPGEGTDLVQVAFAAAGTYVLPLNVENAVVTAGPTVGANITGNALPNQLTGNAAANTLLGGDGNDTLDGGAGNDVLTGGDGDDVYRINVASDAVNEAPNQGNDRVEVEFSVAGTYTLPANVESAQAGTGTVAISLTGTALPNILIGNAGNNLLNGSGGNDLLSALTGVDTIDGGADIDQAFVAGPFAAYTVTRVNATDTRLVNAATNENLTLRNVESVQFSDGVRGMGQIWGNVASAFNDILTGTAGPDSINALAGDDSVSGLAGNDTLLGGDGLDTLDGGADDDNLDGGNGNDLLRGGPGNDTLGGVFGDDRLEGGPGNDTMFVNSALDVVVENPGEGYDTVNVAYPASGIFNLPQNVERADSYWSTAGASITLNGNDLDNVLWGGNGNDVLNGGIGNDTMHGNLSGNDTMSGGPGDDTYLASPSTVINEAPGAGTDFVDLRIFAAATFTMAANVENLTVFDNTSLAGVTVTLTGNAEPNIIIGGRSNDNIQGGIGDDTLNGLQGNDTLNGGAGNDVAALPSLFASYTVSRPNATDTVLFDAAAGQTITLRAIEAVDFTDGRRSMGQIWGNTATPFADVIVGTGNDDLINALAGDDSVEGLGGNDTLIGGPGIDTLVGGKGNDVYVVDVPQDVVREFSGEGLDEVQVAFTAAGVYTLPQGVENGINTGAAAVPVTIIGNAESNVLIGSAGNDTLVGGLGNDTLVGGGGTGIDNLAGGEGDDLYRIGTSTSVVNETAVGSSGLDSVELLFTNAAIYTLPLGVEQVFLTPGTLAINVVGNPSDNLIDGNAGNNSLTGGDGNDSLVGKDGNDTLVGGKGNDTLLGGKGNDSVFGEGGDDLMSVGEGTGLVDGGLGIDTLQVLANFSAYTVTRLNATDTLLVNAGLNESITVRGIETVVFSDGARTMGQIWGNNPSSFDDVLEGTAGPDSIDGLAGNDSISGLGGNDTLTGGAGIDTLLGGAGDDLYHLDLLTDVVVEDPGQGRDLVHLAVTAGGTYTLPAGVEDVTVLSGPAVAVNVVGNALDNLLQGSAANNSLAGAAGNDTLIGGAGIDTLNGGAGDDTYFVDNPGDQLIEALGDGIDSVELQLAAGASYTVGANVEIIRLTSAGAANVTGNAVDNQITGNAANNSLSGLLGHDLLLGGDGNDTLNGGDGNDTLVAGPGIDSLVGDLGDDRLDVSTGNGNDTADGGLGNDTLVVSGPFASYTVTRPTATDTLLSGGGQVFTLRAIEGVQFSDGLRSIGQLWGNVASVFADSLVGTAGPDLIDGLAGNDTLSGLGGDDTLIGGPGDDTLVGGDGDDLFVVDSINDVLVELPGEGLDHAHIALPVAGTYVLGPEVELATVVSAAAVAVNVTGNAADNRLVGNAAPNILVGGAGNDTLVGGAGVDNLAGGDGNDTYEIDGFTEVVNETAVGSGGIDTVRLFAPSTGTYTLPANVENLEIVASAGIAVSAAGNAGNNELTGHLGNNLLNGGAGDDGLSPMGGNDTVDGGAGSDTLRLPGVVTDYGLGRPSATTTLFTGPAGTVLATGVELVSFGGGAPVSLAALIADIGSPGNDTLLGSAGGDWLAGEAGNDVIDGGAGNDTLKGNAGNDTLIGGADTDLLDGGDGSDNYAFDVGNGVDLIEQNDLLVGSVDVVSFGAGIGAGQLGYSRGYYSYDDLVISVSSGGSTEQVVVINFFQGDGIHPGTIDQLRLTQGTASLLDDVLVTQTQMAAAALQFDGGNHVFVGYAGNDSITGDVLGAADDWIMSGGGNDSLSGLLGDDTLYGGIGNDTLQGGDGADVLAGGDGIDVLVGGAGNDTLSGGAGGDRYLFGLGSGQDTVHEPLTAAVWGAALDSGVGPVYTPGEGDLPRAADVDLLLLGSGVTTTNLKPSRTGDALLLRIDGTGDQIQIANYFSGTLSVVEQILFPNGFVWTAAAVKSMVVQPTSGNDTLIGYVGPDQLSGGLGNDVIDGREGNDTLAGGGGNDTLTGGSGSDRFDFGGPGTLTSTDLITDFVPGVDRIGLSASTFTAFAGLAGVAIDPDTTPFVDYNPANGALSYDADGPGGAAAVVIALLGVGSSHPSALGADLFITP